MSSLRTFLSTLSAAVVAAAGAAPVAGAQAVQADSSFAWSGTPGVGTRITIRTNNGNVRIVGGSGTAITVRAVKSWRSGDPSAIELSVVRSGPDDRDILVCATWNPQAVCTETSYVVNNEGNDARVDFEVTVPRTMHVSGNTTNGRVEITDVDGNVRASTVNGRIAVALGDNPNAEVRVSTLNGRFRPDFPVVLEGRSRRNVTATVGNGGRMVSMNTVNGDMLLTRR